MEYAAAKILEHEHPALHGCLRAAGLEVQYTDLLDFRAAFRRAREAMCAKGAKGAGTRNRAPEPKAEESEAAAEIQLTKERIAAMRRSMPPIGPAKPRTLGDDVFDAWNLAQRANMPGAVAILEDVQMQLSKSETRTRIERIIDCHKCGCSDQAFAALELFMGEH